MHRRRTGIPSAVLPLSLAMLGAACSREPEPDAYGNFEAVEVVVSAEASGQLLTFTVREGERLQAGATVGTIDTTSATLYGPCGDRIALGHRL